MPSYLTEAPKKQDENSITPEKWQERITIGKKMNESWAETSGANRFCKYYQGEYGIYFQARLTKIPVPPVNRVFAYVQSDIACTYNRDPYITISPKSGTTKGARLWEVILNYYWRELGTKEEMELELIDKDLVGEAWHKVGHSVESEGTGDLLKITNEKLYSLRVDWRDIVWNVNARRPPMDCEWMAQRIVRSLDDVKAKYPAAADLEGMTHPDLAENTYADTVKSILYKDDIKVAVLWEIWDKRTKSIYLIAEGNNKQYLEDPKPWPPELDEFPFLKYWDFHIPGKPRAMSAIAPWEAQILEEMVLLAQAVNHAKRWNRQMLVEQGVIDANALDKFERGDDGAIIEVNGKLEEKIKFIDFGTLPVDFYMLMDRLIAIGNEINGQPAFDRGAVSKTSTRTIGELQLMKSGAKGRTDRKVDRLETHLENIARHMMAHLKAHFDFEQAVKVLGETPEDVIQDLGANYDPQTKTATFTPEEILGEYDVEVRAGSTLPMDKETRIQILESVLQNVAQVAGQAANSPLLMEVISQILENYDIKGIKQAFAQEMQMAEQAKQAASMNEDVDHAKAAADAQKRQAQAEQIQTETEIMVRGENDRSRGVAELLASLKPGAQQGGGSSGL